MDKSKKKLTLPAILVIISIVLAILYMLLIKPNYYFFNGGEIFFNTEDSVDFVSGYYYDVQATKTGIYFCSRDGIERRNFNNESQWVKGYNLQAPLMQVAGEYGVVGDLLGKDIYFFGQEGFIKHLTLSWPVISMDVSSAGFVTVIVEKKDQHHIYIFNPQGNKFIERQTVFAEDGYPHASVLSKDHMNLATSYLQVYGDLINSRLTFFSFDEVNEEKEEYIIGGDLFEDEVIAKIHYFSDQYLWAIGEDQARVYTYDRDQVTYTQVNQLDHPGQVEKVVATDHEILLYYEDLDQDLYQFFAYNEDGSLLLTKPLDHPVKNIIAEDETYYLVTNDSIIRFEGDERIWFTKTYRQVEEIRQIDKEKYLLIHKYGFDILRVKDI